MEDEELTGLEGAASDLPEAGALSTSLDEEPFLPPVMTEEDMAPVAPMPGGQSAQGVEGARTVAGFRPATASESGRRRRTPPVTYRLDQQVDLSPGDPALEAAHRQAQQAVAEADRQIHRTEAAGFMDRAIVQENAADVLRSQITAEERILEQQRQESRQTLRELSALNQSVMDQRINPARFFTNNRGSGLAAAASVALGVLGQGLNPNIGNAAMTIIDRAIQRDIAAQVANLDNQRAGVAMARNLYGDLLNTFRNEGVAREALRGMYLTEMERRIAALTSQSQSAITRQRGEAIILNLRRQQAEAAANAARERNRISYREITAGAQGVGSTRGIRSAAAQMRASAPLMATGMAQGLALHGAQFAPQAGQAAPQAAPPPTGVRQAPSLPSPTDQIRSQDLRQSSAAADSQSRRQSRALREQNLRNQRSAENETASQERLISSGNAPGLSRSDARRMYRNSRSYFGNQVPNLERIQTPQGPTLGIRTGTSRRHRSGIGADTDVFRPAMSNGRMIAVSSRGSSRFVSPGETLRSNERLVGSLWIQESSPMSAETARYVQQSTNPLIIMRAGNSNWVLPPSARMHLDDDMIREGRLGLRTAQRAIQAVNEAQATLRRLETSGVTVNSSETQGELGPRLMAVQGLMAQMSALGVLQEGEREAIRDMTSLPSGSENWVLLTTEYNRAQAALRALRSQFISAQRRHPLSQYLRRTPSGRDVAARHGAR